MNFFKLYIGDYQRDTGHLSVAEHGAYLLMLQHYYATEKPLPVGKALHRLLRAQDKTEREAIDAVVGMFWRETPEGLVNDRATAEIQKGSAQREINREIGKRGGRPRKTESVSESVSESASESKPNRNPNQTPDTRQEHSSLRSEGRERSPAGSRLPTDWSPPDDWISVAIGIGVPAGAVLVEAEKFRDHWLAKSGKDGRKADWLACWRTWCRNSVEWTYKPKPGGIRGTNQPARLSAVDRVRAASAAAGFGPEPAGLVIDA